MLKEFFAVTETAVFRVSSEIGQSGFPPVTKVASHAQSDQDIGQSLQNGSYVAIRNIGIQLYNMPAFMDRDPIERVNPSYYGDATSPVVALFLDLRDALELSLHISWGDVKPELCDRRWEEDTKSVLCAIGRDHPVFILSEGKFHMSREALCELFCIPEVHAVSA